MRGYAGSVAACERPDPKGLYAMARQAERMIFTGFDSAYVPPESPEILLDAIRFGADG
jgi:adenylylsulfate kinase-like enzyme